MGKARRKLQSMNDAVRQIFFAFPEAAHAAVVVDRPGLKGPQCFLRTVR
jgi:hypothetical protein